MAISESVSYKKINHRKKMAAKDKVFYGFIYFVFALFAIVTLYPVVNVVACSLSGTNEILLGKVHIFPREFTLGSYERLTQYAGVRQGLIVSSIRTVTGTLLTLTVSAFLSFILSRKKFIFRSGLSLFWIITMYASGGFIPTYLLIKRLHLTENFWVYIIPGLVSVFNVIVIRTYMKSIPDSLEEAAQLEGAGYLRVFWSVITPLCKPVYAATALFVAAYHWNSWFDAMIYNRFASRYTVLQYELMKILVSAVPIWSGRVEARHTEPYIILKYPVIVLSMLPLLIVYPMLQKYFVTGLTVGSVKD